MEQPKRRLSAVWFADIVGYSALSTHDEPAALRLVDLLQRLCREVVLTYEGRVVKFIGDACLAEFASTDSAVRSAVALLEQFIAGAEGTGEKATLRIGVHLGEVTATPDGDLYGDGINTASRLQHSASPGQVIISEDVWRQLRQRPEFRFAPLGSVELRGITTQVQAYDVLFGSRAAVAPPTVAAAAVPAAPPQGVPVASSPASKVPQLVLFALLIVVGFAIWNFSSALQTRTPPPGAESHGAPATAPPGPVAVPSRTPADPPAVTSPRAPSEPAASKPTAPAVTLSEPAAAPAEPIAGNNAPARGRAGRGALMAQFPPPEIRSLLQRLVDAVNAGAGREAFATLGPGATAMSGRGAQQMKQTFGEGLSMRLGRVDPAGPPDAGKLPIRFVVLARSNTRAEMPMMFSGAVQRDAQGQLKLVELHRENPGRRGR